MGWQSQRKRWLAITLLSGYVAAVGSSFHETQTMKHSRGTTGSRLNPKLLIVEVGQEWRVVFFSLFAGGRVLGDKQVSTGSGQIQSSVQLSSEALLASFHSASLCTSEASARQIGQVRLVFNHLSTHFAWNSWLQGNTRSSCLHSKSLKHTTHSVCSD